MQAGAAAANRISCWRSVAARRQDRDEKGAAGSLSGYDAVGAPSNFLIVTCILYEIIYTITTFRG